MVNSFLFVVIIRLDRIIHSSLTWIPAFAGMTTPRSIMCLRQLFLNCFLDILKRGFAAENFVINRNVGWLDRIVLMTKTKEPGINRLNFYLIWIFFFDPPGQSAQICSTFSGRTVRINCYLNHDLSPPQKQTSLSLVMTISYRSF
jgi:hypothetical protein